MLKLIMDRKEKNCNKCGLVKNYKFFRKKNNKSGWKDIQGGFRYSYCKQCESDRKLIQYHKCYQILELEQKKTPGNTISILNT
jgi:hypothetical protein